MSQCLNKKNGKIFIFIQLKTDICHITFYQEGIFSVSNWKKSDLSLLKILLRFIKNKFLIENQKRNGFLIKER
jgi:hypothetical protein